MKNKKTLTAIILVVIVLIIGIAAFGYVALSTDTFLSAEQSFWKYFAQNEKILNIMKNENAEVQKELKDTNTYTSNGNLIISILGENDTSQEINVKTLTNHDTATGRTYSEAVLKNGDNDLLKASYINSGDIYALKCEDVLQYYIGIKNANLREMATKLGLEESEIAYIPDKIDLEGYLKKFTLTEPEKAHISNTYTKIFLDSIKEENYAKSGKEQIVVSGISYTGNKYSLIFNEETLKNVLINCLETLKNDQVILSILNRFITASISQNANLNTDELNINNVDTNSNEYAINATDFTKAVEEQIKTLQEASVENTTSITITLYENDGNLLKTVIEVPSTVVITIDMSIADNIQSVNMTIEEKTEDIQDVDNEVQSSVEASSNSNTSQKINLTKFVTQTEIKNTLEIIPDTNVPGQSIVMTTELGSIQNNIIINSTTTTINDSEAKTITATYDNKIQIVEQLEEIMELKNSNAIILNNYTKEQLDPFIESTVMKVGMVIDNKIPQLGINLGNSTGTNSGLQTNSIVGLSNDIIDMIKIMGTAGICITNENGVDYMEIVSVIPTVLIANISAYIEEINENVIIEEEEQEEELEQLEEEILEQPQQQNQEEPQEEVQEQVSNSINTYNQVETFSNWIITYDAE